MPYQHYKAGRQQQQAGVRNNVLNKAKAVQRKGVAGMLQGMVWQAANSPINLRASRQAGGGVHAAKGTNKIVARACRW